jgi:hypothetical protein
MPDVIGPLGRDDARRLVVGRLAIVFRRLRFGGLDLSILPTVADVSMQAHAGERLAV